MPQKLDLEPIDSHLDLEPLDLEELPDQDQSTLRSRLKEFGKGTGSFVSNMVQAGLQGVPNFLARHPDVAQGLAEPAKQLVTGHPINAAAGFFGMNPEAIKQDYNAGHYGALAGDILPQVVLSLLFHRLGAPGEGLEKPEPIPEPVPKLEPVIEQPTPPPPAPQQRLLTAGPEPPKQLPAIGGTSPANFGTAEPRFYQGSAGISDANRVYPLDLFSNKLAFDPSHSEATLTSNESAPPLGELLPIDAANQHFGSVGDKDLTGALRQEMPTSQLMRLQPITSHELNTPTSLPREGAIESAPQTYKAPEYDTQTEPAKPPEKPYDPNRFDVVNRVLKDYAPEESLDAAYKAAPDVVTEASSPEFIEKYIKPLKDELANKESELNYHKYSAPFERNRNDTHLIARFTSSMEDQLGKLNPELKAMVERTQADTYSMLANWTGKFHDIIEPFKDNEAKLKEFQQGLEGVEPKSDDVRQAVQMWKMVDDEMASRAENAKLETKTSSDERIPFQRQENYWPHMYTKETLDALKNNPTDFRLKMANEIDPSTNKPYTPDAINKMISTAKRFGTRLISAEHGRDSNLPGYRTDMAVMDEHIHDIARRIAESENYGHGDLADQDSPLMQQIRASKNPSYARSMMEKLLNREPDKTAAQRDAMNYARKATKFEAYTKLVMSGLTNLGTFASAMAHGDSKAFLSGVWKAVNSDPDYKAFGRTSGSHGVNIAHDIMNGAGIGPSRMYGIEQGEHVMRDVSAWTGRGTAMRLFENLKDPQKGNQFLRNRWTKQLQDLTLTPIEKLMSQPELTEQQLNRSGFQLQKVAQGMAEAQNLPEYWTGSAPATIMTMFHKFAFTQSSNLIKLLKARPDALPKVLVPAALIGEFTGDTKSVFNGLVKAMMSGKPNAVQDELKKRGTSWDRVINDLTQGYAFGIYSDILKTLSSGDPGQIMMELGGPVAKDVGNVGLTGYHLATGQPKKAGLDALRLMPLVGYPAAQALQGK